MPAPSSYQRKLADRRRPLTKELMLEALRAEGKPTSFFRRGAKILKHNRMQQGIVYELSENYGAGFDPDFKPYYSPAEMLLMGVFEGKYCNDQCLELPKSWFLGSLRHGKLSPEGADFDINYFSGVKSRQSLREWRRKGWIPCVRGDTFVRGWFEWYCFYYCGVRNPEVDAKQIARWRSFKRHYAQVKANAPRQLTKRTRQRQALLQWAYNCCV